MKDITMKLIKRLKEGETDEDFIIGFSVWPTYTLHAGKTHDGWTIRIIIRIKKLFRFKKTNTGDK